MDIHKIILFGCGGIGSHFINQLENVVNKNQFPSLQTIQLYDSDLLELKNGLYTTFDCSEENLKKPKSKLLANYLDYTLNPELGIEVLYETYNFDPERYLETYSSYRSWTVLVCAVDNNEVRRKLLDSYFFYEKQEDSEWIDLRAEGDKIAIFRRPKTYEEYEKIFPFFENTTIKNASCQLQSDIQNNKIQYGNVIVATIAIQYLLNLQNNKPNELYYVHRFSDWEKI